jgi:NAD-dependent deacetylase
VNQARNFADSLLRACGEVILCSNSASGFFFLLALAVLAPNMAGGVLLGVVAATLTALLLREPDVLVRRGFYGYNAVLLGILWPFLWEASLATTLLLVPAACGTALIVALHRRMNLWEKLRLPVLCLPALLMVALPGLAPFGPATSAWIEAPLRVIPFEWTPLLQILLVFGAILFSVAIHSRTLALLGLAGAAFGTGLGNLVSSEPGIIPSLHLFTSASAAMALGGYFVRPGRASIVYAAVGIGAAVLLWPQTVPFLVAAGIPAYSLPFLVISLLFLYPLQAGLIDSTKTGLYPVYADIAVDPLYWKGRESVSGQIDRIESLAKTIAECGEGTVALTGAGISTESGIPDIVHGYWAKYNPDDFAFKNFVSKSSSRQAYWSMSEELYTFIRNARPGAGHRSLRDLESLGCLGRIVTQNVDGLHQETGHRENRVIELHGTEHVIRCLDCGKRSSRNEITRRLRQDIRIPYCFDCRGILKTDATLDGEPVSIPLWKETCRTIMEARLLLVVGTSLRIPAIAELVERAARGGTKVAIISLGPTPSDRVAQFIFRTPIRDILPHLVRRVRALQPKTTPASAHKLLALR